ncbi:MAG: DUF4274 domain-containing protein [bacterium]|nr:DUF4274 domain-containing protein [bacterium]
MSEDQLHNLTPAQRERVEYFCSDAWVALDGPGGHEDELQTRRNFADFLKSIESAEELHCCVDGFHWDTGPETLEAFFDHSLLDRGTLLMMYWRAAPGYYMKYQKPSRARQLFGADPLLNLPEDERPLFRFIQKVERLLLKRRDTPAKIAYDPANDRGEDLTKRYGSEMRKHAKNPASRLYTIPEILFQIT